MRERSSEVERQAEALRVGGSIPSVPACEWCGHAHAVTALCARRPTWGRRGFLALMGAAIVGAALPSLPVAEPEVFMVSGGFSVELTEADGLWRIAQAVWTPTPQRLSEILAKVQP